MSIAISDRILDSGWIQGVCADILSHTWPVRGGDQPRTTPMPFQRISTDLCGSPDHPRRAKTAERATLHQILRKAPPTKAPNSAFVAVLKMVPLWQFVGRFGRLRPSPAPATPPLPQDTNFFHFHACSSIRIASNAAGGAHVAISSPLGTASWWCLNRCLSQI